VPPVDAAGIEHRIHVVRGVKVMLDVELAALYGSVGRGGRRYSVMAEQRYDGQFQIVFDALRELTSPDDEDRARIGFD
jgi:hypothetical protein